MNALSKFVLVVVATILLPYTSANTPNHSGMINHPTASPISNNTDKILKSSDPIDLKSNNPLGFNDLYHNTMIAKWSLQQINASLPQLHDPWVVDFIYRTTSQMNALARQQALIATPIIKDKNINAFAVAGGVIALNTGVILSSDTLDETASVLAHEIGHLSMKHYERSQDDKNKQLALQLGGLVAAIAASAVSGDGAMMAIAGAQTISAEHSAAHSRMHEKEADRIGMALMSKAGFDAHGMPRFFDKLNRHSTLNGSESGFVPSFVQTHPFTAERLSEARTRANHQQKISLLGKQEHSKNFDLLYWRIKYLSKAGEEELKQASQTSIGAKLAYVAFLADKRRFDEAHRLFANIDKAWQDEPLYCISKAHIHYEKGEFVQAVSHLSACHAIAPERKDLSLYLADSLVQAGQGERALALLLPITQKTPHDLIAQDLLQKTYQQLSQSTKNSQFTAKALQARASKELWYGNYDKALISLTQAKTESQDNPTLLSALDKDIQTVKAFKQFKP